MEKTLIINNLGNNKAFKEVWEMQEIILARKIKHKSATQQEAYIGEQNPQIYADQIILVEHAPVYTLGKSGKLSHVLISEEEREEKGIDFFKINRGGDITFHGPGQLVGYPILDLEHFKTDLGWYLRSLEEVIILTLAEYGIVGGRSKGETGVWIDADIPGSERKICAMGIRCSRWVTMHGFAFNVNTNLEYFNYIVPCGIYNKQVTSLEKELGYKVDMKEVTLKLLKNFEKVFEVRIVNVPLEN